MKVVSKGMQRENPAYFKASKVPLSDRYSDETKGFTASVLVQPNKKYRK